MKAKTREFFLRLVRLGIWTETSVPIPSAIDWSEIKALADAQRLTAVVLDAIGRLDKNSTNMLPLQLKLNWIGEVLQSYEQRYELYKRTIGEMAGFYNSNGYKMMIIKGYACSLDWPKPEHRPCGDIDIWQFGQQQNADALLAKEKKIKIDTSHHHHTVFYWRNFMVENHYDFVNVYHSKSNASIEKIFKILGSDDTHYVDVNGEKLYLPSPNLHALFLLRHAMIEFAASGINLRQLLDWAFFVKAHRKEVDWKWLESVLEEYGMKRLYEVFNAICTVDLGFDADMFTSVQVEYGIKERVLNEILSPMIPNEIPKELIARIVWKYRRWKANEWKRKLVYKEGVMSAFWSGMWNHLLKPASI